MRPYALIAASCAAVFVSGCAGSAGPSGGQYLPNESARLGQSAAKPAAYSVVHEFDENQPSEQDGYFPVAGLVNVNGTLYGTMPYSAPEGSNHNAGMVFAITTSGTEKVVHQFGAVTGDGATPVASLVDVNGTLYGTTELGGKSGAGTVFKVNSTDAESVVHSFGTGQDGNSPQAGLLNVNGTLYGTTEAGGTGYGTAFSITASGTERVLHRFGTGADGKSPVAGLVAIGNTLYGTTPFGGSKQSGTVFSMTTSGTTKVIHSFANGTDGSRPSAKLVVVGGVLYGTTEYGGAYDSGTVFSITPTGTEKVLYSFGKTDNDGQEPMAGLIAVGNALYGTTTIGGAFRHVYGGGGTLYKVTTAGVESILHSFGSGDDGIRPMADLLNVNGTLYGTTEYGGTKASGTVFAQKI
jgi:uncharacterized repeat protein (TIGR03803 family)